MSLIYTHRDDEARRELDLELEPTIDPGQDGGRWEPSWSAGVEDCTFRVLGLRLLDESGQVEHELSTTAGTLPEGTARLLAQEFETAYLEDRDLRRVVDGFILRMEEICPA